MGILYSIAGIFGSQLCHSNQSLFFFVRLERPLICK